MTALLDVNVLVALAWPNHVHHDAAARWFRDNRDDGWATCPLTESGFVRVSSNPAISGGSVTPAEATTLLSTLRDLGAHRFWTDDVSFATSPEIDRSRVHGHRQVADAHLVAVAIRNRGTLATFDRGARELVAPADADGHVLVLVNE